jgi:RNA 2',3'-cyclic 3'-phosphodiesterase
VPRLFVAVWPPPDVLERLELLPRPEVQGVRWIPRQNWHVTLRFIGNADPTEVASRLDMGQFRATIAKVGPATSRLGRNLVIRVGGLNDLAARVSDLTADVGAPVDARGFTGHITLARLGSNKPRAVAGAPFIAEFPVPEVTLVGSNTHPTGARYTVIGRWPTG